MADKKTMQAVNILNLNQCEFKIDEKKGLRIKVDNEEHDQLNFFRAFPLTFEERYISVVDHEKKEIGIIDDLSELSETVAEHIRQRLYIRYFTPVVEKIHQLKEEYGYSYWTVDTDAGPREFTANRHDRPLKKLKDGTLQLSDTDGNRYKIIRLDDFDHKHVLMIENLY